MQVSSSLRGSSAPLAALEAVAVGGPAQGQALIQWLVTHPAVRRLSRRIRDDVVQSVGLTLLQRGAGILDRLRASNPGLRAGPLGDQKLSAYVGTMLRNRALDHHRLELTSTLEVGNLAIEPTQELTLELREVLDALSLATEQAIAQVGASRRGGLCEDLRQLRALALGEVSMEALVAQRLARDPASRSWTQARDLLYKRHRRARAALIRALWALHDEGALCRITAQRAEAAVGRLLRQRG